MVSLTIVRYKRAFIPLGLISMAVFRFPLYLNKGCSFWKLLGCGRNGTFDLQPDLQQWGLLACWENEAAFQKFKEKSFISKWWKIFTIEQYTILCSPFASHGLWDKNQPFSIHSTASNGQPVAILTRATIRLNKLKKFWNNVDKVAKIMTQAPGYITSFGIGEAPFFRQATFSIWQSLDDVKSFAYRSDEHKDVIQKTRKEDWYSEELFARFNVLATFGTINGNDPLADIIKNESRS